MDERDSVSTFTCRVAACKSIAELDKLHSLMCRTVPICERPPYLLVIDRQEERLQQRFYLEKQYL